jgi:hypothetical protein
MERLTPLKELEKIDDQLQKDPEAAIQKVQNLLIRGRLCERESFLAAEITMKAVREIKKEDSI